MSDRTILITGAAGALGRAAVETFLEQNARLILVDRESSLLTAAFPRLAQDGRHLLLAGDVTAEASMTNVVRQAIAHSGRIHALVHIAGGFTMGEATHATARATWDGMVNLNAWSFIATTQALVPHMIANGGGSIVAVSARAAAQGSALMGAYCAAKSALQRLVESLSAEVRAHRINVNSIAPSLIDTPANRAAMPEADFSQWVPPRKLAQTMAFLTSEAASEIHGDHIIVAGLS
ncbi:MAG: SDR family NAD(P)-dependent oxidoreductase [Proteobacteria bacterium]|nr:SDR family NAD(P)-dependent oxidoreductase [Pseudomonadota bacterium]HQR03095.1 SDR family NAD(P)-dependent oxidoreductase [Rhodocyclaceae bacterium]